MSKSKLILGTVQFGLDYGISNSFGKPSNFEIKEILDFAHKNEINILDTAEAYGDSQERIGNYHKNSINKFQIITKFSSTVSELPKDIKLRIQQNINTLQVTNLYCYMFHSFKDFRVYFKSFEKDLVKLKEKGIIKNIGVSIYTNEEFDEVLNFDNIDIIQLPFNLLDNFSVRGSLLKKAKEKGIEIHTRSVFLQGLFFKKTSNLKEKLKPLGIVVNKLQNICTENYRINDLALNYAYHQKNIDNVIIGVDSVLHLQENISSIGKSISKDIINEIDKISIKEKDLLNPSNWN